MVNPGSSRAIEAELAPIREALEAAFVVARRDRRDTAVTEPPRMLNPFLEFAHLPERALGVVRDALERDERFRSRVAEQADTEAMEPGSKLFLERPDGWALAVQSLVDESVARAEADDLLTEYTTALEQVEELRSLSEELTSQRDRLATEVDGLRSEVAEGIARCDTLKGRLDEASTVLEALREERNEAVRQLKAQEELAERRLRRQRQLEHELDTVRERASAPSEDSPPPDTDAREAPAGLLDPADMGPVAESMAAATASLAEASEAMGALARILGSTAQQRSSGDERPHAGNPDPDARRDAPQTAAAVPGRRRAIRLGRGLRSDSVEGLEALLGMPGAVVMVDGYNVSMKGWPNLHVAQQRQSLMDAVAAARPGGATWHLVFDGAHDGARPVVKTPLPVRVHFTPSGVEADDRLLEFVTEAPRHGPVVVVSSDNRVRDGARALGANVVSSETLLALLRRG